MLNRRFLRIKAFQALYSFSREGGSDASSFRKRMLSSLDKTYELYLFMLSFAQEFKSFLNSELDSEKAKFLPSDQQKKNLQFLTDNKVIKILENSPSFADALKKYKVSWSDSHDLFRQIWNELKSHNLLIDYLRLENPGLQEDKALLAGLIEWLAADSDIFENYVEERFLNWEDDQVLVVTTLQRTLQMLKENSTKLLAEKHKDEAEDLKFMKDLFDLCIQHDDELMQLIAAKTKNWDQDRIALVDLILMKMALCEVLYFPFIPVKVSINEYLELAKLYSTPNSHGFINGILDKVQIDLRENKRINKMGRGLVD